MAHICKQCDKKYSSYKSLWFHNYKYHKEEKDKNLEKEIKIEKHDIKKFICDKCNKNFNSLDDISNHSKNDCRPSIKSNNIYKFKTDTFGKNKYKNFKGGDVYIIQTEFNLKGFYKIGVSTDLYNRLSQYRCGNLLEPKLHYYYPCKNIKETDKLLKIYLQKFNIKREIYHSDNIDNLRNAIKEVQKESNSSELEIIPENKECDITPCQYCDLYFTNKQDLVIHLKINHKIEINEIANDEKNEFVLNKCKICDKFLANRHSRWRHEKICKKDNEINIVKIKEDYLKMKQQLLEQSKIIDELMKKIKNEETTVKNIIV